MTSTRCPNRKPIHVCSFRTQCANLLKCGYSLNQIGQTTLLNKEPLAIVLFLLHGQYVAVLFKYIANLDGFTVLQSVNLWVFGL